MKKMLKKAISLIMILAVAFTLTGCGSKEKTLETFVNDNATLKTQIESMSQSDGNGKMIVDIKDNKVTYTYTFHDTASQEEVEQLKEYFNTAGSSFSNTFGSVAKQLEEATKIKGITVEVIYLNVDSTELWKGTYTAK